MPELTPKQLKKMEKGAKFLEDKDFTAFEQREEMIDILEEIKDKEMPEMPTMPEFPQFPTKIEVVIPGVEKIKIKGDKGDKGDRGDTYILTDQDKKEIASKIKVPVVEKIIEKTEVIKEQPIVTNEIKEVAVTDTAEDIRNKLELLTGEERLSIGAIDKLQEILDDLKKQVTKTNAVFVGGGSGGKLVKSYDLSPSLNGVTKKFTLPAFWRVISVHSSSFPGSLRETTDWTSSASDMSITFTDEIDAATTLATGQTITIIYSE